jgi:predicted transcriptional regulator YdeE
MKIKFEIIKSIEVNKSLTDIYQILSDVNQWNNWSPWACLDPEAKIDIKINESTGYTNLTWDGKLIGSGEMIVTNKTANTIHYDLNIFKPFKTKSKIWFELKSINDKTEVNWGMASSLPIYLFFLKKMMMAYMGADYNRGLIRLKEYAETGTILCKMSNVKNTTQEAFYVVGKKEQTSIDQLGPAMNNIFDKIMKDIETRKLPIPNGFISLYHNFDLIKSKTEFSCGVFYNQKPELNSEYEILEIEKHDSLKMDLKGTYTHLPTAWSKIWCHQRGNKIDLNKKIPFYEIYLNSPKMVAPEDVHTELRLPIFTNL